MSDKTFQQAFKENMEAIGLPVPSTIYGSLATTLGTVGAIAGAIAKVGAGATVAELFLTLPLAAGGTAAAVAVTEIVAVVGALAASFYVGACIGSIIVAAYETLDVSDLMEVISWLRGISSQLGTSIDQFLSSAISSDGRASPIRSSVVLAQANNSGYCSIA